MFLMHSRVHWISVIDNAGTLLLNIQNHIIPFLSPIPISIFVFKFSHFQDYIVQMFLHVFLWLCRLPLLSLFFRNGNLFTVIESREKPSLYSTAEKKNNMKMNGVDKASLFRTHRTSCMENLSFSFSFFAAYHYYYVFKYSLFANKLTTAVWCILSSMSWIWCVFWSSLLIFFVNQMICKHMCVHTVYGSVYTPLHCTHKQSREWMLFRFVLVVVTKYILAIAITTRSTSELTYWKL